MGILRHFPGGDQAVRKIMGPATIHLLTCAEGACSVCAVLSAIGSPRGGFEGSHGLWYPSGGVAGGWTEPVLEAPGFTGSSLQPTAIPVISQHSVTTPQSSCDTGKSKRSAGARQHLGRALRPSMCTAGLSVWPEPADRRQLRTLADT